MDGNKGADQLAKAGIDKPPTLDVDQIPTEFNLTGANLHKATQKLLYKGIRQIREKAKLSKNTDNSIEATRDAATSLSPKEPTTGRIFTAIAKDKDLTQRVRIFLWKAIQGAHKCGPYWERMSNATLQSRDKCKACKACNQQVSNKSIEHILLHCKGGGPKDTFGRKYKKCVTKRKSSSRSPY